MQNNQNQVKKDGLPVVSENEQVRRNCMRLYVYLISISQFQGKDKPRTFTNRDFTINKIHTTLDLHALTIKKYWRLLEENDLIKYEGPAISATNQEEWDRQFSERTKNKAGFYTIPKRPHGYNYRIIPRETIEKIQSKFVVNENELKIYFLLANMQEHFCYMKTSERIFTLADLRELLKLTKHSKNNKMIYLSLLWLEEIGLIETKTELIDNNLGQKIPIFNLISVNYYTNGGRALRHMENDKEVMSSALKSKILDEVMTQSEIEIG